MSSGLDQQSVRVSVDDSPPARHRAWLFTGTVLVGSFLMFQLEPMVAKMALPRLGGAPGVWNSAMLVYQALLLAGYCWAHLLARFRPRTQGLLHLGLLGAACLWLPIGLTSMKPPNDGSVVLFVPALFLVSLGPLFFAMSAQAPLMQRWFNLTVPGVDPYRLYAASNLGSFAGLLTYPFVVEPSLAVDTQRHLWTGGYLLLVVLVAACALRLVRSGHAALEYAPPPDAPPTRRRLWTWVALAAVPSGLMLSTTIHITTDVMAMPLLWVVPLGLYLLSFTVAFAHRRGVARLCTRVAPVVLLVWGAGSFATREFNPWVAVIEVVSFFVVAVALHTRLYESRPSPQRLTLFYLMTSVGGVLGGVFCALLAPVIFDWVYEHPILLLAAALLLPLPTRRRVVRAGYAVALASLILGLGWQNTIALSLDGARSRSYFATYAVEEHNGMRTLRDGTTLHGLELTAPGQERTATTYYGPDSGVGLVLDRAGRLWGADTRVGAVGLGVGTIACYATPGESWRFFEIDPLDVRIAQTRFSFLKNCTPDAPITIGDARLELEKVPDNTFDVLVVDAFSSDSIPMHLITAEAFDVYDRVTAPGGLVLIHISNRFINLEPALRGLVVDRGWHAMAHEDDPNAHDVALGRTNSVWVAMSRDASVLDRLRATTADVPDQRAKWDVLRGNQPYVLWTDQHSSILQRVQQP